MAQKVPYSVEETRVGQTPQELLKEALQGKVLPEVDLENLQVRRAKFD